jgi:hypothetical protein
MSRSAAAARRAKLGVVHCTFTGCAVLGILFLLAWATEAVADIPASQAFVAIFTQQALGAPRAQFASGLASAIVIGGMVGGLVALCFNLFIAMPRPTSRR